MKDIIKWLREIEHMANRAYMQAASTYADDPGLKDFLEHTAEDEAWHYHVMGSAADFLKSEPEYVPAISIDEETSSRIVNYFSEIRNGIENGTLSKTELIEKIATVELSEWNDIFIYVVNFLKDKTGEFKYPAARMQAHIKEIEHYLETVESCPNILEKIKALPPLWIENILIVDDEEMITSLIKSLLNRSGEIDVAFNGQDALNMMEAKYYKLIVTDVDMPVMDGLTFFKESVSRFPSSKERFLFMSGDVNPERQAFFDTEKIKYLVKPMGIKRLREIAAEIILSR